MHKKDCIWLIGQAVKTPPSHGGNRGSIPLSAATVFNSPTLRMPGNIDIISGFPVFFIHGYVWLITERGEIGIEGKDQQVGSA